MIRLSLVLPARRGEALGMASALRPLMVQAQSERGFLRCQLSRDLTDPDTVHYLEEWASEEELQHQVRSERFRRLIAIIETAVEPPRFAIEWVSQSCGLSYVEDLLGSEA